VILSGSILMDRDSPVAAALLEQLPELLPGADPRRATLPPAAGAALDALAEGGVAMTPAVIHSLDSTVPPSPFFRT
jgi:hypothetical protein